jgi:hypothetical protein
MWFPQQFRFLAVGKWFGYLCGQQSLRLARTTSTATVRVLVELLEFGAKRAVFSRVEYFARLLQLMTHSNVPECMTAPQLDV